MAPGCFSGFWCGRRRPSSDDRTVSPVPAPTGATRPDSGSPPDNRGMHDATAVETNHPGTSPGPGHVEAPVPVPTQGSLPPTGILTPALSDVQPTGSRYSEGSVHAPELAQAGGVPSGSLSSRPIRMDPAKAKWHIDRIGRFRILVMGRANAGKTTILERVCSTTDNPEIFNGKGEKVDAAVVHGSLTRGHHNIEDELVFKSNPRYVFHDSCGFESGSVEQFDIMTKFVTDRAKTTELDKRIHAIWFCIPLNESHRMMVAAEKKFFNECDTGYVPVILLATKVDTLELEAFEMLEDQGLSEDDGAGIAKLQEDIAANHMEKIKNWLGNTRFPPHDYLTLTGMQQEGANCKSLLTCTVNALKEEGLQQLLISTQQSNLELCMEFAIMKSLKRYMEEQDRKIQPAILAHYMSMWFPFREEYRYGRLGQQGLYLGEQYEQYPKYYEYLPRRRGKEEYQRRLGGQFPVDNNLLDTISHCGRFLTMPTLSSSMQYSMQYYAEHGVGSILVFEYLYFLLQVQDGRDNIQECLNLAVKEYESSGIHTKVDALIQKAFEKHGEDVDDLCPCLVHIVQEYQLSKILTRKG